MEDQGKKLRDILNSRDSFKQAYLVRRGGREEGGREEGGREEGREGGGRLAYLVRRG